MIDLELVAAPHERGCTCHVCAAVMAHEFNVRQMRRYVPDTPAPALGEIGRRLAWIGALRAEHGLEGGEGA